MYCTNCGKDLPDGARVCPECGKYLGVTFSKYFNVTSVPLECGAPQSGNAAQAAPPVHPAYAVKTEEPPVSVSDWMITALLTAIPLVGFIMLFVWGFGGNVNTSKKNWARAALIWMAISAGLVLLFWLVVGLSIRSSYYYY